ncbi:anti-anti-sigma factor [Lysobacter ruishenii]|uniref:Anti-anti-sigma factor n=1 Tax=Aerolutibacter ruishenii TaxID=686800 RepID=A0A562LK25_9GAMM|nr:anti-anti-sigma factor [Lysobacter ruishenii]
MGDGREHMDQGAPAGCRVKVEIGVLADGARARLSGDLDISCVASAKAALLDAIECHPELEFDLSGIRRLDAAGMQLLILCKRMASQRRHGLRLVDHSPAVIEQFELFNLAAVFGDPMVVPARSNEG